MFSRLAGFDGFNTFTQTNWELMKCWNRLHLLVALYFEFDSVMAKGLEGSGYIKLPSRIP